MTHPTDSEGVARRVLVCGGRDYNDQTRVDAVLNSLVGIEVVIQGDARGADRCAANWARAGGANLESYPADWQRYGRRAGYVRNTQMLVEGKPDLVVAFSGGRGTAMMMRIAREAGVPVMEVPALSHPTEEPHQ